jgi:hypothetical protein
MSGIVYETVVAHLIEGMLAPPKSVCRPETRVAPNVAVSQIPLKGTKWRCGNYPVRQHLCPCKVATH